MTGRAAVLALALLLSPAASAASGDKVYSDPVWTFDFLIPQGWQQVPLSPDQPGVRLRLKGPKSFEGEVCNVTVADAPDTAKLSPAVVDQAVRGGVLKSLSIDELKHLDPDATVQRSEVVTLNGHPAQITETRITMATNGRRVPFLISNLMIAIPGRGYSANCGAAVQYSGNLKPELDRMLRSLTPFAFKH